MTFFLKGNRIFLFVFCLCLISLPSKSQELQLDSQSTKGNKQSTIFVEVLGPGILGSINFDQILYEFTDAVAISWRAGFGMASYSDSFGSLANSTNPRFEKTVRSVLFPTTLNILFGKKNSKLEIGLGFLGDFEFVDQKDNTLLNPQTNYEEFDFGFLHKIGYRYQKINGGIYFALAYYGMRPPFVAGLYNIDRSKDYMGIVGLSVGYTFKKVSD